MLPATPPMLQPSSNKGCLLVMVRVGDPVQEVTGLSHCLEIKRRWKRHRENRGAGEV